MVRILPPFSRSLLVLASSLLLTHASRLLAAETAVVAGRVVDTSGRPIASARIVLEGDGTGKAGASTGRDGRYRIPALQPRTLYRVRAEADDRRAVEYDGLFLEPNRTRIVDFRLKRQGEWDVVVLASRDPFPYEGLIRSFTERLDAPVRVIDLDSLPDPEGRVRQVAGEKPNLVLGTGLRAARLIRREIRDIPSILTLIDDPRRYDLAAPNLCFLGNNPDPVAVVREVRLLLPRAGRLGIVYDADTSSMLARDLREPAEAAGLRVVLRPLYGTKGMTASLDAIRSQVDALLVPYDLLTATPKTIDRIAGWARRHQMPLFAPGPDWARAGALFGFGATPGQIGIEAAGIAGRILGQTLDPFTVRIQTLSDPLLAVNRRAAADLGIEVPPDLHVDLSY